MTDSLEDKMNDELEKMAREIVGDCTCGFLDGFAWDKKHRENCIVKRVAKALQSKQDRIDELESALKPFIENYDKYGNHGPFAHGLFQRAKKAIGGGNAGD